jgi:hypothetical protein
MKNARKVKKKGVVITKISDKEDLSQLKTKKLKESAHINLNLLKLKQSMEQKKIEKLKENLHFIGNDSVKNNHIIFVKDEKELDSFNPEKFFDTHPLLAKNVHNRFIKNYLKKKGKNIFILKKKTKKKRFDGKIVWNNLDK